MSLGSMVPAQRSCVNTWECDRMGHLNVQFYLARWTDARAHLALKLGFPPSQARDRRIMLGAIEDRVLFKRELREGAITTIHACVRAVVGDTLHVHGEMREGETGISAATFDSVMAYVDLATGATLPLPDVVRTRAEIMAASSTDLHPPPVSQGPSAPTERQPGLIETGRGTVNSWEIDWHGHMASRFFMARFSDAASHLLANIGLDADTLRDRNWGSAALDYRLVYRRRLRAGDAFVIRSGMLEVQEKVWRFFHQVEDISTGEIVCIAEIVALLFDLSTRKSFAFPSELRERVTPLLMASR